jgi:outer membrane protein assembly factor BamB
MIIGFGSSLFAQGALKVELPSDTMLGRLGLQRAWWAYATLDPLRDRVKYFLSDEQDTFVQSATGIVTAFNNANGHRLWSVQVGNALEMRFPAVANERFVIIISGTTMYALNKLNGDVAWQVDIPTAASTAPGIDDTRAYVGSINGTVYAFDLKFLEKLSKDPRLSRDVHRAMKWQYKTGARIMFPPISTGKVVIVASADASLYGLAAEDRKLHFQFETDQPLSAPIAQVGHMIFVATEDRKAYCIDADSGAIKWELLSGLYIRQAPRVIGEHAFLRPEGYGLRCLSMVSASDIWTNRQAVGFLAATPAVVYASDSLGNVLLLNQKDGRQIGAFSMRQFPIRIANDRTDRMYFASEHGLVVCIRERERDFPLFHKNPEKRPLLPEVAPDEQGGKASPAAKKPPAGKKKAADGDEAADEEKKENGDASPAADENTEKPAPAKPAKPSAKPPVKPADPDNQ